MLQVARVPYLGQFSILSKDGGPSFMRHVSSQVDSFAMEELRPDVAFLIKKDRLGGISQGCGANQDSAEFRNQCSRSLFGVGCGGDIKLPLSLRSRGWIGHLSVDDLVRFKAIFRVKVQSEGWLMERSSGR